MARSSRCCAHKGRNYATQHRTQRLDPALVCERRCLIRAPCVRTSQQKGTGGALTARPHEAPPQHRLGTWVEDHDPPLWSKVLSAPDGAGRPPWRTVPGYAHKGRNYATQHRTQRLDSALVCERRCLIRVPCVRTSREKEPGGALTARPHEAPPRCRSACLPWHHAQDAPRQQRPCLNTSDDAARPLALQLGRRGNRPCRVSMHLMVQGAP